MLPDAVQVPPINGYCNIREITALFGGAEKLRIAVNESQKGLYARLGAGPSTPEHTPPTAEHLRHIDHAGLHRPGRGDSIYYLQARS